MRHRQCLLDIASAICRRHHRTRQTGSATWKVTPHHRSHQHVIISDCCSWWPRHNSFYHCSAIWQSEIRTGTELWHSESDFTQNDLPIVGGDLICITLNVMNDSSQGLKGRNCNWPNSMPSPIQIRRQRKRVRITLSLNWQGGWVNRPQTPELLSFGKYLLNQKLKTRCGP